MAKVIFEITWSPTVPAQLASLLDNGHELLDVPRTEQDGRITMEWEADELLPHSIKWHLFAVGVELKELKAIAAWEGGQVRELGRSEEEKHHWTNNGTLFAKAVMQ